MDLFFSARPQSHGYRKVIEDMSAHLKDWRAIVMRYTRCGDLFLSAIALAAVIFWLR